MLSGWEVLKEASHWSLCQVSAHLLAHPSFCGTYVHERIGTELEELKVFAETTDGSENEPSVMSRRAIRVVTDH